MRRFFLALPFVFLLAGCNVMLPAGNAPEGKITDNSAGMQSVTAEEFENHAATSLSAYMLSGNILTSLNCTDEASVRVLEKISSVTGTVFNKKSPCRLRRRSSSFVLLSESNEILWQYPSK